MKYTVIFSFICLFGWSDALSQSDKEQAIFTKISEVDSRLDSIDLYLDLAKLQKNHDLPAAVESGEIALALAEGLNDEELLSNVKYYLSLYLFMIEENELSKVMIREILPYYQSISKSSRRYAILLNRLAKIELDLSNYDAAKKLLNQALAEFRKFDNPSHISVGFNLLWQSDMLILLAEYEDAIRLSQEAYNQFEAAGDFDKMSAALSNFAEVQLLLRDYNEARTILTKILDKRDSIINRQFLIKPMNMMGIVEYEQGNFRESKNILNEALKIINEIGNFPDLPKTYLYLSKIANQEGLTTEAVDYAQLALQEAQKSLIKKFEMDAQVQLGQLYLQQGQNAKAKYLSSEALDWAKLKNDKAMQIQASKVVAEILKKEGSYQKAFQIKQNELDLTEELFGIQKVRDVAIQQIRYEIEQEQKAKEVEAQLKEKDYQYEISRAKSTQRNLLIGLGTLLLMAVLLIRSNMARKDINESLKEKNTILSATEESLEQKNEELERYIESNIQLQQFAHIASHDLKSPLRTVGSFIGLLKRSANDKLTSSEQEYLNIASQSTKDMYMLVEDLLSYSKVNALQLSLSEFSVEELMNNVLQNLNHTITECDAKIVYDLDFDTMFADEIKLRQVIQNLIANSIKFVEEGVRPEVTIRAAVSDDFWTFSIRDNGIGIQPEYYQSVFEPFKQLNNKREYTGTGLGLALCKKIIEKHNGKIWIENHNGNSGSKFVFTIGKPLNVQNTVSHSV